MKRSYCKHNKQKIATIKYGLKQDQQGQEVFMYHLTN